MPKKVKSYEELLNLYPGLDPDRAVDRLLSFGPAAAPIPILFSGSWVSRTSGFTTVPGLNGGRPAAYFPVELETRELYGSLPTVGGRGRASSSAPVKTSSGGKGKIEMKPADSGGYVSCGRVIVMFDSNNKYWPVLPAALALAGVIVFIFATFGPPASSSGFVTTLKGFLQVVAPEYVNNKAHYKALPGPGSWLMGFISGHGPGRSGRRIHLPPGNPVGAPYLGTSASVPGKWRRYLGAFIGGFLILFASRLAGGCTLGLFISGGVQLGLSGLYFGLIIFGTAMITARLLFAKGARGGK